MKNKKIPTWLTIEQEDRHLFFALTVLYGVYVLPILLANRPYQDDLSRSLYGVTGWNNDARPLTEKLMTWLCGGTPLGNVAPLPLLLSVLLLAYTLTLYGKRYLPSAKRFIPALGIGFLVIANPFFLSNLSYQFDCVTMVLALCTAILPLLVLSPSSFSVSVHSLICLCSVGLWAGVMLSALYRRIPRLSVLLFLPCLLFGLTFSFTYGNALTNQKQYETYLTYSIAHDVETLNADGAYRAVTVSDRAPRSPEGARLCEKYPLFRKLVPTYLTNASYIGGAQLLHYTKERFDFDRLTEEDQALIENTAPALANSVYACYESGDKIIICFK